MFITLKSIPLLWPAGGWVLGLTLARLDSVSLQSCLVLLTLILLCLLQWRKAFLVTCILGLFYGLLSYGFDVQRVQVSETWLNHKISISAVIADVKQTKQYTRLRLKDITSETDGKLTGFADVYVYRPTQDFTAGMAIAARVKFHVPHNKLNPVGFDYAQYAFTQHLAMMGSVSGKITIQSQNDSWLNTSRNQIRQAISSLDHETGGILLALLLGDRSQIPLDVDDAFAASGATHLLAISGLHMGLVAGWGFLLSWWLLTRREVWIVNVPVRAVAMSLGLILAMTYATLAGWPIPAQRASLMLLAGVMSWWFRARQVPLNSMLASLMLIVLLDPAAVLSVSLWLSFVATSALLMWAIAQPQSESMMIKLWSWFKAMLLVSLVAAIATLPLIGFIFERLPAWSLIANMMLVPLYSVWVLPLGLLGELSAILGLETLAHFFLTWAALGLDMGNQILFEIYALPAGKLWLRGDMPWMHVLLCIMIIISSFLFMKHKFKLSLFLLSLSLIAYAFVMTSEAKTSRSALYVWDVGQGASAWLQLPNFNLLVDAPGKALSKFNGGSIAAENIRALGVLNLDAVVVSHAQSDHAGGIPRLLSSLNGVGELWLADVPGNREYPFFKTAAQHLNIRWLKQGDIISLQDAQLEVLWPPLDFEPANANNTSLVLLVRLATGQQLLLPGDMEKEVEQRIIAALNPIDVLLMPHHGSKTSSTTSFVKQVKPKVVIAQTGYKNQYGFPKAAVVQRYQAEGSEIWNTADGAVTVYFDKHDHQTKQFITTHAGKRSEIEDMLFRFETFFKQVRK